MTKGIYGFPFRIGLQWKKAHSAQSLSQKSEIFASSPYTGEPRALPRQCFAYPLYKGGPCLSLWERCPKGGQSVITTKGSGSRICTKKRMSGTTNPSRETDSRQARRPDMVFYQPPGWAAGCLLNECGRRINCCLTIGFRKQEA